VALITFIPPPELVVPRSIQARYIAIVRRASASASCTVDGFKRRITWLKAPRGCYRAIVAISTWIYLHLRLTGCANDRWLLRNSGERRDADPLVNPHPRLRKSNTHTRAWSVRKKAPEVLALSIFFCTTAFNNNYSSLILIKPGLDKNLWIWNRCQSLRFFPRQNYAIAIISLERNMY